MLLVVAVARPQPLRSHHQGPADGPAYEIIHSLDTDANITFQLTSHGAPRLVCVWDPRWSGGGMAGHGATPTLKYGRRICKPRIRHRDTRPSVDKTQNIKLPVWSLHHRRERHFHAPRRDKRHRRLTQLRTGRSVWCTPVARGGPPMPAAAEARRRRHGFKINFFMPNAPAPPPYLTRTRRRGGPSMFDANMTIAGAQEPGGPKQTFGNVRLCSFTLTLQTNGSCGSILTCN